MILQGVWRRHEENPANASEAAMAHVPQVEDMIILAHHIAQEADIWSWPSRHRGRHADDQHTMIARHLLSRSPTTR